ncbi:hypothetical protein ABEW33_25665 [Priestia megaterium]|uniref:hypothetical protein n=1 Tax=Priestia megaterium TaxID=1404 RepID=UPI0030C98800
MQHKANHYRDNLKEKVYKGPEDLSKRQAEIKELEEKVVPSIEKEIKAKEHTIKTISGIFDAIQQTTHSEEQAQQRHQLGRMRSTNINRSKDQGPDLSR